MPRGCVRPGSSALSFKFPNDAHVQAIPVERRRASRVRVHAVPSIEETDRRLAARQSGGAAEIRTFRILLTDLKGDDADLAQTRHLEAALPDHLGLAVMPVGEAPDIADGEIDAAALGQCRALIAEHNGDSLIFGEVMPAAPRIRIRMVGRYEQEAGRYGPYQADWIELPKRFGPDVEGLLLTLMA